MWRETFDVAKTVTSGYASEALSGMESRYSYAPNMLYITKLNGYAS